MCNRRSCGIYNVGVYFFSSFFNFYICNVPMGFLLWEIRVAFPGESQLRQSRAAQPTVHVGCFNVSIIYRTLTSTAGFHGFRSIASLRLRELSINWLYCYTYHACWRHLRLMRIDLVRDWWKRRGVNLYNVMSTSRVRVKQYKMCTRERTIPIKELCFDDSDMLSMHSATSLTSLWSPPTLSILLFLAGMCVLLMITVWTWSW